MGFTTGLAASNEMVSADIKEIDLAIIVKFKY